MVIFHVYKDCKEIKENDQIYTIWSYINDMIIIKWKEKND